MTTVVEKNSNAAMMDVDNRYQEREATTVAAASSSTNSDSNNAVVYSPELLQQYYSRLFPFSMLTTWLSYSSKENNESSSKTFTRREFSFTIEPTPGQEVYIRYQSFGTQKELSTAILKRRPTKIDIGAVFSHPPKDHNTVQKKGFLPVQRELVFDIDLTDYDEVRTCGCSGAKICPTCWTFMQMAVKVMDQGLKQDFGFEHVAWFYSGRRGVHAWVCDETARELTDEGRSAVAHYFEVNLGTDKNKQVHLPHPLHPMLARAYAVLEPLFIQKVLPASGHGVLANSEQWTALLQTLPDAAAPVRDNLLEKWQSSETTPAEKWSELKKHLQIFVKGSKSGSSKAMKSMTTTDRNRLENWPAEIVFRYTYPRLDINVSKMRNHLLKSPFCVHPKTGRVCVPFSAKSVDEFDPFQVPTLAQLMDELDQYDDSSEHNNKDEEENDNSAGMSMPNWKKTSLKSYFETFQGEFLDTLIKTIRRQERDAAEQEAAMVGDF